MGNRVGAEAGRVRIAAVGALHMRESMRGRFRPALLDLAAHADVLLLAGDLTNGGTLRDTGTLCAEIADLPVPVIAVLGNHDHDRRLGFRISVRLNDLGVHMLDGTAITLPVNGIRLGIAGVMGGSGGFPGHPGNPAEGSVEHRQRFRRGPADALRLRAALESLDCDLRVALMHFSPWWTPSSARRPRSTPASAATTSPTPSKPAAPPWPCTDTPTAAPNSAAPRAVSRSAMSPTRSSAAPTGCMS